MTLFGQIDIFRLCSQLFDDFVYWNVKNLLVVFEGHNVQKYIGWLVIVAKLLAGRKYLMTFIVSAGYYCCCSFLCLNFMKFCMFYGKYQCLLLVCASYKPESGLSFLSPELKLNLNIFGESVRKHRQRAVALTNLNAKSRCF